MLSRIAEVLYWMGRYLERAENTARLLQVNYYAIAEAPLGTDTRALIADQWGRLLAMTDNADTFAEYYPQADEDAVVEWLAFRMENPASIRSSLFRARENARMVRFHINLEMWEALNRAYNDLLTTTDDILEREGLSDYCVAVREASHLFFGIAEATLPRNEDWHFLAVGRYLERADNVLRFLQVHCGDGEPQPMVDRVVEDHRHRSFLRSVGALEAFRKAHYTDLELGRIADFLLLDSVFPRSVRWSALRLAQALEAIGQMNPGTSPTPTRLAGWFAAQLQYMPSAAQVIQHQRPSLDDLLLTLAGVSDAVGATYFARGAGPDLLASTPQQ